ncbi:MAG TPA: DinB family protein, partial [Vicinamibacterales bacterium]
MTYYGAQQLAGSFRTVRANTIAIAEEIPEEKYGFKATPDVMSVAQLLAHIAVAPNWHVDAHGPNGASHMDMPFFTAHREKSAAAEQRLSSKADIVRALKEDGERFSGFLESLDEERLSSLVTFPPPVQPASKTRFEMLLGVKEH